MINTSRLELRTLIDRDLEDVYEIYSYEETCQYLLHEPWNNNNKVSSFEAELKKNDFDSEIGLNLGVVLEDKVIGVLSAWRTEMTDTAEIGFSFNKNYSGQGYATEVHMHYSIIFLSIKISIELQQIATREIPLRLNYVKESV